MQISFSTNKKTWTIRLLDLSIYSFRSWIKSSEKASLFSKTSFFNVSSKTIVPSQEFSKLPGDLFKQTKSDTLWKNLRVRSSLGNFGKSTLRSSFVKGSTFQFVRWHILLMLMFHSCCFEKRCFWTRGFSWLGEIFAWKNTMQHIQSCHRE